MEINAILGAIAGAVLGAIVWAGIAVFTGYEIGWIAWGVGGAVGFGAHAMEGRGVTSGIVCAVLAALAILGGKMMVVHHFVNEELAQIAQTELNEEYYQTLQADAADFAALASEADYANFMIGHGFTEAASAESVPQEDIDNFKELNVPELQAWAASPPSYKDWHEKATAESQAIFADEVPMTEMLFSTLGPMDLLFFALGIGTAFKVGSGGETA